MGIYSPKQTAYITGSVATFTSEFAECGQFIVDKLPQSRVDT